MSANERGSKPTLEYSPVYRVCGSVSALSFHLEPNIITKLLYTILIKYKHTLSL
jgi:hypothetical protein